MEKTRWGTDPEGHDIYRYAITGTGGMRAVLMNYGANLLSLEIPNKDGDMTDVVLGFDKPEDYFTNAPYFGCCVAPCANRIGNATFSLNQTDYELERNDGANNLHSGSKSLCKRMWDVASVSEDSILFTYDKQDMEMGFPGNMRISVRYTLTPRNELRIEYTGYSDTDTVFNPTNHSYFNLTGHDSGSAMEQLVWVNARRFTMTDNASIPNGILLDVAGTPMDFTTEKPMEPEIDNAYEQLAWAKGYDHNYALDIEEGVLSLAASLEDPISHRKMEVYTDLPGIQLYAGNYIRPGEVGKGGFLYQPRCGICFETQYFPNAINIPGFSQPVAKAGVEKKTCTVYRFLNN